MTTIVMGLGPKCQPQNSICFFAGGPLLDCLKGTAAATAGELSRAPVTVSAQPALAPTGKLTRRARVSDVAPD